MGVGLLGYVLRSKWRILSGTPCTRQPTTSGAHEARIGPFTPKASNGGSAADGVLNSGATAAIAHNGLLAIGIMRRLAQAWPGSAC